MLPDTRYARRGGLHLAYQVLGSGPPDILLAEAREILVSSTVKDLVVGSGLEFEDRGSHELKGVPGDWRVYAVRG